MSIGMAHEAEMTIIGMDNGVLPVFLKNSPDNEKHWKPALAGMFP